MPRADRIESAQSGSGSAEPQAEMTEVPRELTRVLLRINGSMLGEQHTRGGAPRNLTNGRQTKLKQMACTLAMATDDQTARTSSG